MREYTITRLQGAPDWASIPALLVDTHNWLPPVPISTAAQICYDETGLYVHLRSWEKEVRAQHDGPLSMVCEDSCMEFFFRPEETDPRYFNFEMNPKGRTYIGFGFDRYRHCRLAPNNEDALLEKEARLLENGWEVYYKIPVAFLQVFFPGYALTPGKKLYANCFKCGDLTPVPHYLSWNPCTAPEPDFHQSRDFGLMTLG